MKSLVILLAVLLSLSLMACSAVKPSEKNTMKKDATDLPENREVLLKLYGRYKNGEIAACKYDGQTVYCAMINAYDAPSVVYDAGGNEIGSCNFAYGHVDSVCWKLTGCEVIYRVKNNIWGAPAVDNFGLRTPGKCGKTMFNRFKSKSK